LKGLTIGEFAQRTGVAEGTLRMWERRHDFPSPERLAGGHRRYSEADIELVRRVASERIDGLSLAAAITRAKGYAAISAPSVHAALRRRRPDLEPRPLRKPLLLALTHAIEDESLSRAERPVLFASFQNQRFYAQARSRWRELSRGAELTVVFADFKRARTPRDAPAEIPIDRSHPLAREWTVICCAADHAVCLTAWERPEISLSIDRDRVFETIWSVERDVVWDAAGVCAGIAAATRPALIEPVRAQLESSPSPTAPAQLRLAAAITNRLLAYLS
jgi:MerR family transcriptional regulator, light-induced transcriptional regulator